MKRYMMSIIMVFLIAGITWADGPADQGHSAPNDEAVATATAYFDTATGHCYVKEQNGQYAEFNRKGKFFRYVSAKQTHLATNADVHPIPKGAYKLYTKHIDCLKKAYKVLPCHQRHPEGWRVEKLLLSID